jgi:uncharacterized membrane protein YeaQ/YmgE (transglycosylase-associated protein family)
MVSLILWAVFGAIVGFIADYIDRNVALNWTERVIVGIVGAIVGGSVTQLLTTGTIGISAAAGFDPVSMIVAVLGALGALFVYKRVRSTRSVV